MFSFITAFVTLLAITTGIRAESHSIRVINRCGRGTPYVMASGKILLKGQGTYTRNDAISSAIAFLDTGGCYPDGLNCIILETTLINGRSSACPSHDARFPCVSSSDLSLIPGHRFNVPTKFWYENGCNGAGHECNQNGCKWAFYGSGDNQVQVQCGVDNVNLAIQFC